MSKFKVARTWTPLLCLVTPQTVRMLTLFFSADVGGRKQTVSAIHTPTVVTERSPRSILHLAAHIG